MKVQAVFTADRAPEADGLELRERIAALSERIVALAEAANIISEAAAPFRALTNAEAPPFSDGFKALDRAAARLEAARLAAVDEFTEVQRRLEGEPLVQH